MFTYEYKLKPKAKRDGYLDNLIDRHNMLWNKFVWLEGLYRKHKGRHLDGKLLNKYTTFRKKGKGWDYIVEGMDAQSIQAAIQRREVAYDRFFKNVKDRKNGKRTIKKESPPQYKKVKGEGSFTLKQTGWRLADSQISVGNFVKNLIHTYGYYDSRTIQGKIKTITIKRDRNGEMWLYVVTDHTPIETLCKTGIDTGFDFDADHFFVDKFGGHWDAPRVLKKHLNELKALDRKISRCKKGSGNQNRLYAEKRRINRKIENVRNDWQWKMAREMCQKFDVLCFEGLDLLSMGRHDKTREKGLTPIEKRRMKKFRQKLRDYAPASFIEKVKWIAQKTGKEVLIGDQWDKTSQKCSKCKAINSAVKDLSIKRWECPVCHEKHDRDINAAINVELDCKAAKENKRLKGPERGAGGASSVDVGQSGEPERVSRWARIRKPTKPQGEVAGLVAGNHHNTQTHGDGQVGGIPQASAVGECQKDGMGI